jgi:hypothetical protein
MVARGRDNAPKINKLPLHVKKKKKKKKKKPVKY